MGERALLAESEAATALPAQAAASDGETLVDQVLGFFKSLFGSEAEPPALVQEPKMGGAADEAPAPGQADYLRVPGQGIPPSSSSITLNSQANETAPLMGMNLMSARPGEIPRSRSDISLDGTTVGTANPAVPDLLSAR